MGKLFYFGGQFNFRYKDYSIENIENDYRSKVLGDYRLWLNENDEHIVRMGNGNYYVGPFYFTKEKSGHGIVALEQDSVSLATDCVFVLSNNPAPGTVTEIIEATNIGKNVYIFYVKKDIPTEEIDTEFKNDLWYPITFAALNAANVEISGFDTYDEAVEACIKRFDLGKK